MAKRRGDKAGWYNYTVTGIFEKTPPNRTPTQFIVNGHASEQWCVNGKKEARSGKSSVLIPTNIEKSSNFFDKIPLGSKVKFRESSTRNGRLYKHNFSIEVLEEK